MKIGIITFNRAINYGAVLQAYALQKFLDSLGIDSDIIDYRSPYIEEFYKPIKAHPLREPKTFIREVIFAPNNLKKRKKFNDFSYKYLRLTKPIYDENELKGLNNQYDCFISGSDQVWNLKWSGFDKVYFLDFAENEKKYSYAASFGFERIPEGQEQAYAELLREFKKISVRENTGKNIISELLGRTSEVSLDPTCLLTKNEWKTTAKKPADSGYVLLYTLERNSKLNAYAKALALEKNTKVIYIADAIKKSKQYSYQGFLSPEEFVGLFANAGYVVTNSFHGLMFAVIFEKQFCLQYQQKKDAPNSRLSDFLHDFDLEDRVMVGDYLKDKPINYIHVKKLMEKKKDESRKYFESINNSCNARIKLPRSKEKCSGCRACEQICPKQAITMRADEEGFLYPIIDNTLCIKCGQCIKVCTFSIACRLNNHQDRTNAFVGFIKSAEKRKRSRSGGIFVAVSDAVLEDGGTIYGAGFNKDLTISHGRAETEPQRNAFCGSKYVQSDTNSTFSKVYQDLKAGKKVLFSGTACQVSGLKSYLKQRGIQNTAGQLVTMDIVCHGVVSPKLWNDNLVEIEKNLGEEPQTADFRDKSFGWDSHIESYTGQEKRITSDRYTAIFYSHAFLRPSCYVCPYASIERCADITLADAWGIGKVAPEWDSSKGVSLVLVNTDVGMELFDRVKSELEYKSADLSVLMQPNLQRPTSKPKNRELFWDDYASFGFNYVANKCVKAQNKVKQSNRRKAAIVQLMRKLHLK